MNFELKIWGITLLFMIYVQTYNLTGCDTTSKIGTKKKALAVMKTGKHPVLKEFGSNKLDDKMLEAAEKFLVKCVPKSSSVDSFDSLRHAVYHSPSFKLDIEKFPCCTSS